MDEAERERAERDLEIDPVFRATVVEVAERMHLFDLRKPRPANQEVMWDGIAAGISKLPHMTGREIGVPEPALIRPDQAPRRVRGVRSLDGRRGAVLTIGLIIAFALGYLAGVLAPPW